MDALEAFCLFDILFSIILAPFMLWNYHSRKGISGFQIFFYVIGIIFCIFLFYRMIRYPMDEMNWG